MTGSTTSTNFANAGGFETTTSPNLTSLPFVAKLNASGSAFLYSTYLDGSLLSVDSTSPFDSGNGIAVDAGGNAYVTGLTGTSDFPTTQGAYDSAPAAGGFLTKLNVSGSALLYSTKTSPGNSLGVAVDTAGDAYVIGLEPTTNPACLMLS